MLVKRIDDKTWTYDTDVGNTPVPSSVEDAVSKQVESMKAMAAMARANGASGKDAPSDAEIEQMAAQMRAEQAAMSPEEKAQMNAILGQAASRPSTKNTHIRERYTRIADHCSAAGG
jgi:hypothetical protein